MKRPQILDRFTPFQIAITALLSLSLALQIGTVVVLLRARPTAQLILSRSATLVELADGGPYIKQATLNVLLARAADGLTEMGESHIQYTVHISQSVVIASDIVVNERIPVPVSLTISDTIPINADIPLREKVLVPVDLEIDQVLPISMTVPFKDEIVVPVDDVIHVDERFEIRVLGQDIRLPIRGDIPVKLDVKVPIDKEFPIQAEIPVQFPISETLPVEIAWTIPVDLQIPVNLPVETEVLVPINQTIPISIEVPVVLDVPIDIPIGETPLGEFLLRLGEQLRQITRLN